MRSHTSDLARLHLSVYLVRMYIICGVFCAHEHAVVSSYLHVDSRYDTLYSLSLLPRAQWNQRLVAIAVAGLSRPAIDSIGLLLMRDIFRAVELFSVSQVASTGPEKGARDHSFIFCFAYGRWHGEGLAREQGEGGPRCRSCLNRPPSSSIPSLVPRPPSETSQTPPYSSPRSSTS